MYEIAKVIIPCVENVKFDINGIINDDQPQAIELPTQIKNLELYPTELPPACSRGECRIVCLHFIASQFLSKLSDLNLHERLSFAVINLRGPGCWRHKQEGHVIVD